MTHALDDHGVLGNAIKDEVGIRADQHAPDARNVGLLSDMRMLDEQSRDLYIRSRTRRAPCGNSCAMASMISSICRTARLVKRSFTKPAWPKEPLFGIRRQLAPGDLGVGLGQIGAFLGGQADNLLVFSGKLKQRSRKLVLDLGRNAAHGLNGVFKQCRRLRQNT
jgi:hypothetical protein